MARIKNHWRLATCSLAFLLGGASLVVPAQAQPAGRTPEKLKFVVIVSRHGVRSPTLSVEQLNQYSRQPWPKWEVPPGYLTPHGAQLMTTFGGYYRSYFAQQGLLSPTGCGDSRYVSFYSDSDQRTVETGKSLAEGMFPGCPVSEQSEQHALAGGQPDPLFHSVGAGVGQPNRDLAVASIAGRIGNNPSGLMEAYRSELDELQSILLGCPAASPCPQPGSAPAKLLTDIPASLDRGSGDHLAELKGPLNTASTITESFLLEYANGLPADQVGWGHVELPALMRLMDLHTAASDLTRRSSYLAAAQASNALAHILKTMQQAATGKVVPGALGTLDSRAIVMVGHDTNLSNIAGMLNINWLIDGRRDDTPPGGALIFELWQKPDAAGFEVRAYYTAQTLLQMRNASPLTLDKPPARADVFLPGCTTGDANFSCDWGKFQQILSAAIDPAFVK
jgi:4-phytase / acid phosphatase